VRNVRGPVAKRERAGPPGDGVPAAEAAAVVVREPDETLQAVARMVRELVEARAGSRRRTEAVRPRSTADLVTLLNAGVITLAEARRYLLLSDDEKTRNRGNTQWS
jgi:hypothetical protein